MRNLNVDGDIKGSYSLCDYTSNIFVLNYKTNRNYKVKALILSIDKCVTFEFDNKADTEKIRLCCD